LIRALRERSVTLVDVLSPRIVREKPHSGRDQSAGRGHSDGGEVRPAGSHRADRHLLRWPYLTARRAGRAPASRARLHQRSTLPGWSERVVCGAGSRCFPDDGPVPLSASDEPPAKSAKAAPRPRSASTRFVDALSERSVGSRFRWWFAIVIGCGIAYWLLDLSTRSRLALQRGADRRGRPRRTVGALFSAVTATLGRLRRYRAARYRPRCRHRRKHCGTHFVRLRGVEVRVAAPGIS